VIESGTFRRITVLYDGMMPHSKLTTSPFTTCRACYHLHTEPNQRKHQLKLSCLWSSWYHLNPIERSNTLRTRVRQDHNWCRPSILQTGVSENHPEIIRKSSTYTKSNARPSLRYSVAQAARYQPGRDMGPKEPQIYDPDISTIEDGRTNTGYELLRYDLTSVFLYILAFP